MIHGCDISAYQDEINWPQVKQSGLVQFVYAKATEGTGYVSDQFRFQHDGAKEHGIPVGAYHFFHFAQDPEVQAKHFLDAIEGYQGTLLPMVDVEGGGRDGVSDLDSLIHVLSAFIAMVDATLGGKRMLLYTDSGDWNDWMKGTDAFAGHPLWVASFGTQPGYPVMPGGWHTWQVHQYTSGGTVPGIAGAVDVDVAKSLDALLR